ncbi:MAG: tetratricopeptide repeat protein [Desulfosporosinus sp.]|jgi:tetratricopeptide (TPR) repeat protein
MDYAEILAELEKGLTGNCEHDARYLEGKALEYREHEYSKEILRGIGRMLYKLLPEKGRNELNDSLVENSVGLEDLYQQALGLARAGSFLKAEEIMTGVLDKINGTFEPDMANVYLSFDDAFQGSLYADIFEEKRNIHPTPKNYAAYYFFHGQLLIELGKPHAAITSLLKAVEFNPVNCRFLLELGDAYRRTGDLDNFYAVALQALDYALEYPQLARCYRDFGYYYIERQEFDSAVVLYWLSTYFKDDEMARRELGYIREQTGMEPAEPSTAVIEQTCSALGIRIGPNPQVIDTAITLGKLAQQMGKRDLGLYCYQLAYNLTGEESILAMIQALLA